LNEYIEETGTSNRYFYNPVSHKKVGGQIMDGFLADFDMYTYVVIPLLIMFARICDVSIGTLRVMFVSKGYRKLAAFLGFLEVMIWVLVGRQVLVKSTAMIHFVAYAVGFGIGNYIGLVIEDMMSLGIVLVMTVLHKSNPDLLNFLKEHDIGFTVVEGEGVQENVEIVFSVVQRENLSKVVQAIKLFSPKAFYSIEDIRAANAGIFPRKSKQSSHLFTNKKKAK
jgi:uncharacterized protein YebE (UPF0316 family)